MGQLPLDGWVGHAYFLQAITIERSLVFTDELRTLALVLFALPETELKDAFSLQRSRMS